MSILFNPCQPCCQVTPIVDTICCQMPSGMCGHIYDFIPTNTSVTGTWLVDDTTRHIPLNYEQPIPFNNNGIFYGSMGLARKKSCGGIINFTVECDFSAPVFGGCNDFILSIPSVGINSQNPVNCLDGTNGFLNFTGYHQESYNNINYAFRTGIYEVNNNIVCMPQHQTCCNYITDLPELTVWKQVSSPYIHYEQTGILTNFGLTYFSGIERENFTLRCKNNGVFGGSYNSWLFQRSGIDFTLNVEGQNASSPCYPFHLLFGNAASNHLVTIPDYNNPSGIPTLFTDQRTIPRKLYMDLEYTQFSGGPCGTIPPVIQSLPLNCSGMLNAAIWISDPIYFDRCSSGKHQLRFFLTIRQGNTFLSASQEALGRSCNECSLLLSTNCSLSGSIVDFTNLSNTFNIANSSGVIVDSIDPLLIRWPEIYSRATATGCLSNLDILRNVSFYE